MVESGPKQPLSTKTAHINPLNAELNRVYHLLALLRAHHVFHISGLRVKGYLAECLSQWKMCGTEVGEMTEIHMLLSVYFPASEAFAEGVNTVDTGTFFFASLFFVLVYHMNKVFIFPLLRCSCVLSIGHECSPPRAYHTPSMAMMAGRGQEQDVYMTSRPLVPGSEPTSTVSVVHTHTHTKKCFCFLWN